MTKKNSKYLRKNPPKTKDLSKIKRNPIYLVLDRVLDTYNIGSVFRLADAIAAEGVYLCGDMEYPPSSRIHKAAVGTEAWVPWKKVDSVTDAIKELKRKNVQIISVEQSEKSIPYTEIAKNLKFPVAIVVGHETDGISKEGLEMSDLIIEFPMYGINKSFNVWGSAAIAAYKILESL